MMEIKYNVNDHEQQLTGDNMYWEKTNWGIFKAVDHQIQA